MNKYIILLINSQVTAWLLLVCGAVFCIVYPEIFRNVWKKPMITSQPLRSPRNNDQEKTVALTCLLVVVTYLICTTPYAVRVIMGKNPLVEWTGVLLFCNSIANPIVYFFKGYLKRKSQQKQVKRDLQNKLRLMKVDDTRNLCSAKNSSQATQEQVSQNSNTRAIGLNSNPGANESNSNPGASESNSNTINLTCIRI